MKIKDITTKIGSGATPTGGENAYKESGIALIRSQNVLDFSFSNHGLAYIDEVQAQKLDGVTVKKGDVLLNITGDSIARCCMAPEEFLPARVNQHVAIIRSKDVSSEYLMYYLQYMKPYLLQICGVGGTRNALTKESIENIPFFKQENEEKIAAVLSDIDAKIANNAICADLEGMAKLLYDYWFVQFDFPDENGKPYKSSGGKMVWNEELKREIPEEWEAKSLKSLATIQTESISPFEKKDSIFEHYSIPAFDDGRYPVFETGSEIDSNKYRVPHAAILVSKLNPQFKRIWDPLNTDETCICSTEFMPFVCRNNLLRGYVYFLLNSDAFQKYLVQCSSSSTGSRKRMQPELCGDFLLAIPESSCLMEQFSKIVIPMLEDSKNRITENAELTSLRDFLLPMLMNGQVKVKEGA
ncbi:MAG: restriction endonuclease subunit S [Oscillospiraceae bacterium]|nr:restriction endonuclease subunit S [Oscillospiraceae bacterium]